MESIDKNIQNIGNGKNGETVERFTKRRKFGVWCLRLLVASVLLATFFAILSSCAEDEPPSRDYEFLLSFVDENGESTTSSYTANFLQLMQTEPIATDDNEWWDTSDKRSDAILFTLTMPAGQHKAITTVRNVPYGTYYVYNLSRSFNGNRAWPNNPAVVVDEDESKSTTYTLRLCAGSC